MTITRKPLSSNADSSPATTSPPYPVTPSTAGAAPPFQTQNENGAMPSLEGPGDDSNAWRDESGHTTISRKPLPESLRAGPSGPPPGSQDLSKPDIYTNPYLQTQAQAGAINGHESSADAWGGPAGTPDQPSRAPPPPPVFDDVQPPTQAFGHLTVSEPSTNPWQPALDEVAASRKPTPISTSVATPSFHAQDSGDESWSSPPPARTAPIVPVQEDLIDLEEPQSPAWDEDDGSTSDHELPAESGKEQQQLLADQHAWDETREQELHVVEIDTNKFLASEVHAPHFGPERWNLIDHESTTEGQESGVVGEDGAVLSETEDEPTKLPSQISQEQPGHATIPSTSTNAPLVVSPAAAEAAQNQKKETYEIKKISWHDVNSDKNPRTSPILVQNANGPCPLLALVNALTLSTPANVETALVDTLRSREQVSLGLLLDAVLDELMSGRRGDAAQELPDVSDLYYFLITLHTGMNVNPRFFPAPPSKSASDPRNSMSHVHPAEREEAIPGTFEDTREMKLYSTFSVPLIHGWLPAQGSPEYIALKRSATSYEDAQNLMFHEEVLEEKLRRDGLSFEEQATLEDISTIKAFFHSAATQLTAYGLETITVSLAPGAVAILFRNDHFSTLYRHPDTLQLLQLVTDMGYAGHEEVVWESLTDVNGENAEFFSGDFRLVGGAPGSPTQSYSRHASQSNTQWTSAENSSQSQSQSFRAPSPPHRSSQAPQSPTTEQEDHDLALALQLQEEEEERHRDEIDRRRRETELSQQYIEQQGSQPNSIPVTNQRRGGGGHRGPRPPPRPEPRPNLPRRPPSPEARPIVPPRTDGPGGQPIGGQPIDPEAGVDAPPPSYEQAATQAAYVPPADHPSHPNSDPSARRRASAFDGNSQAASPGADTYRNAAAVRRRAVTSQGTPQKQQQDKDCIVM